VSPMHRKAAWRPAVLVAKVSSGEGYLRRPVASWRRSGMVEAHNRAQLHRNFLWPDHPWGWINFRGARTSNARDYTGNKHRKEQA
jgi:hypothetical protein